MALPTNTLATYESIGNREDLSDVIYNIDPIETPFVNAIDREKASAVLHEWQTQALAAAGQNAQLEGDDQTAEAATPTVRLSNDCQISKKTPRVTGTQRAVQHAGRGDEMVYQEMLKGRELKRDIETILLGGPATPTINSQAKNAGADATARKTANLLSWMKSNTSKGTSGVDPAAADGTGTRTDGTQRLFTEQQLKTVLASAWNNGGKPDMVMAGSFNKQTFSTFTGRSSPIEQAATKKITAAVSAYESDFGLMSVIANRFQRARDVWALQEDMWALAYLNGRKFVSFPLAKTGDSDAKTILSEYALVSRNEKSSALVADLATS